MNQGVAPSDAASDPGPSATRHRVVIVGGGFGGLYAAKQLKVDPEIAVTLIDRRNFHLFQPMLYQVATGALSPGDPSGPERRRRQLPEASAGTSCRSAR